MADMRITDGKGVHFTFNNGLTLSIQIGGGNYCDNYDFPIAPITRDKPLPSSTNAELALWNIRHEWLKLSEHDDIRAYVPVADVVRFIAFVDALPSDQTDETFQRVYADFSWSA